MARRIHLARFALLAIVIALAAGAVQVGAADSNLVDLTAARDFAAVRALLAKNANVNIAQPDGATALHWAAHWDDVDIATLLLRAGAVVNAENQLGVSPLALACENGSAAMVSALVAAGADLRLARPSGETALMTCARTGSVAAVRTLLKAGANPQAREKDGGQTALMWATDAGDGPIVRTLIDGGADVNARSLRGFSPLLFAARSGALESARMLVTAGADVNAKTPDGQSALLVAAYSLVAITGSDYRTIVTPSDHEALALFLLDHGADARQADKVGMTALHAAVEFHKPALMAALVGRGVDLNARIAKGGLPFRPGDYVARTRYAGATAFWLAANAGEVAAMKVLVAAGADWRVPNDGGVTPLMVAAGQGQTDSRVTSYDDLLAAVKYLVLELGADINGTDPGGQTAMHGAASASADAAIEFLASRGAPTDVKDRRGRTPADVAMAPNRPRPETAALLRRLSRSGG